MIQFMSNTALLDNLLLFWTKFHNITNIETLVPIGKKTETINFQTTNFTTVTVLVWRYRKWSIFHEVTSYFINRSFLLRFSSAFNMEIRFSGDNSYDTQTSRERYKDGERFWKG